MRDRRCCNTRPSFAIEHAAVHSGPVDRSVELDTISRQAEAGVPFLEQIPSLLPLIRGQTTEITELDALGRSQFREKLQIGSWSG